MKNVVIDINPHFFDNFSIKEEGVKLNSNDLVKIRSGLQGLESRAPSYSSITLKFTNRGQYLEASLIINSAGNHFFSTLQGDDPWELYKQIESEVDYQISEWKRNRFSISQSETSQRLTGGYAV